ncbi:MAG: hypothetical protein EVA63_10890 [Halieaceae bacterium]|jgi:multidrug transporter EmrE-like cation transporter|nr:MAG: hypothetical protein EVA63_10890 [Halieaceae bacterium]
MVSLTPTIIAMLAASVVFQVIGLSLMPLTKGLTEIVPSIGCGLAFLAGTGLMARLLHSGINLGVLLPFVAAIVPLCAIAVGMLFYGESASLTKLSLLVSACLVIGFASSIA